MPEKYKYRDDTTFDENFFQYSRELLLYNTILCWQIPSSGGYEAAETGDYKDCFTKAFSACSQCHRDKTSNSSIVTDVPIHRFATLTASKYVNTQMYRLGDGDLDKLDSNCFKLLEENRELNYRIYEALDIRPRIYFTNHLVFVESFKDFQKMLSTKEAVAQTQAFDNSNDATYLLNRDSEKFKDTLKLVTAGIDEISKDSLVSPGNQTDRSFPKNSLQKGFESQLVSDNGQELRLKLRTEKHRLLVIADHYYPGWVAELDGKPVEILKANLIDKAIIVPPGAP